MLIGSLKKLVEKGRTDTTHGEMEKCTPVDITTRET
jgi:hypothetical protein